MFIIALVLAYLMGAFPTAYVVGRYHNIDITREGSGNVGGTNTLRVMGWKAGLLVAVVDVLKAAIPALLAQNNPNLSVLQVSLVALAAIVGHNWSVFIGFKGGKGIACTIGVSAILFPQALFISLTLAVLVVLVTRYVSLGSIFLTVALPVVILSGRYSGLREYPGDYFAFAMALAVLAVYRHWGNIKRLLAGTERKVGEKR